MNSSNAEYSDGVITVCYGKEEKWDERKDARHYFLEAMMNTEGSERERYANVYFKIIRGFDYCTDSDDD